MLKLSPFFYIFSTPESPLFSSTRNFQTKRKYLIGFYLEEQPCDFFFIHKYLTNVTVEKEKKYILNLAFEELKSK